MADITQKAGNVEFEIWTGGAPIFPTIKIKNFRGDPIECRVRMADLHDLRYCIDRVFAQLEAAGFPDGVWKPQ